MTKVGDFIGPRWRLTKKLRSDSGQGNTFLAVDDLKPDDSTEYVVKLLKVQDSKALARFEKEIKACLALQHPNIVKVIDSRYEDTSTPYLVTEYCAGGELTAEKIKDLSIIERLRMFESICEAMAHAHGDGVIHRDIKPGNIFLKSPGLLIPIVGDFGLCFFKDDQNSARQTAMSESMGNWQFGPPERSRREEHPSGSFDVYQLGKLLYWALSDGVILDREYYDEPYFDLRKNGCDDALYLAYEVIAKSVVEDSGRRYQTAVKMLDDVKELAMFAESNGRYLDCELPQSCVFCRVGAYRWQVVPTIRDGRFDYRASRFDGLSFNLDSHDTNVSTYPIILFGRCRRCGNVQQFRLDNEMNLSSDWKHLPSSK
ncbi:MAG: serine/threonine-protein kinase [Pyrinomonadaceae bacterium]